MKVVRSKEEPKFVYLDESFTFNYRSAFFKNLHEDMKQRFYISKVTHCHSFINNTCYVREIDYITRSLFIVGLDEKNKLIHKTLRELILPHPFSDGRLEDVNTYPFARPVGSHILLKRGNEYYFQVRSNMATYPDYIDPTAGGAVDWRTTPRQTVMKEMEEEVGIRHLKSITYLGYMHNYHLLLDTTFLFVGETKEEPKTSSEVKEILTIQAPPEELVDELKPYIKRLTPSTVAILKLLT